MALFNKFKLCTFNIYKICCIIIKNNNLHVFTIYTFCCACRYGCFHAVFLEFSSFSARISSQIISLAFSRVLFIFMAVLCFSIYLPFPFFTLCFNRCLKNILRCLIPPDPVFRKLKVCFHSCLGKHSSAGMTKFLHLFQHFILQFYANILAFLLFIFYFYLLCVNLFEQ